LRRQSINQSINQSIIGAVVAEVKELQHNVHNQSVSRIVETNVSKQCETTKHHHHHH